ncbi:MAG: hypothetical protein IT198_04575 [Acidimicrobiia bacterium]|nr:hypothetical protein [Acidimicrobiia bacterium]
MSDTVVFLDANVLASPVTRTLLIAGGRFDGLLLTWSASVEAEADRHARGTASRTSVVRREILGMRLSKAAPSTRGLLTSAPEDRQVIADAISAGARYLVTTDVDDFAAEDLDAHAMSAVNPDYFMALRFSARAYGVGVRMLADVAKNPPRTEAEVHMMLGRRHPNVTSRFADSYESTPVPPDPDQPNVRFRGAICVRCEEALSGVRSRRIGLCSDHLAASG